MDATLNYAIVIELINANPPMNNRAHTSVDFAAQLLPYCPEGTKLQNLTFHLNNIAKEHTDKLTAVTVAKEGKSWLWRNPVATNMFSDAEIAELESMFVAKCSCLVNLFNAKLEEKLTSKMGRDDVIQILIEEVPKRVRFA